MEQIKAENNFEKICLIEEQVENFALNQKYLVSEDSNQTLSLISIDDGSLISRLPLNREISCLAISDSHVSVVFNDGKLSVFLVSDPNDPNYLQDLNQLSIYQKR